MVTLTFLYGGAIWLFSSILFLSQSHQVSQSEIEMEFLFSARIVKKVKLVGESGIVIGKMEDRLLILLDLDRILSANELHKVNRLATEAATVSA
jgi:hypothetical protein